MPKYWTYLIFLLTAKSFAQGANIYLHGPGSSSTGGHSTAVPTSIVFSPNPAIIFDANNYYYLASSNVHSLPGLWHFALQTQWHKPTIGTGGVAISRYGDKDLSESYLEGRYGRLLSEKLSAGVSFSFFQWQFTGYESLVYAGIQGGLGWRPSKELTLGYTFYLHTLDRRLGGNLAPHHHSIGLCYEPIEQLQFFTQIDYPWQESVSSHWGLRYRITESLHLSLGFATRPFTLGSGAQFYLAKKLLLEVAFQRHQTLGYTLGLGVGIIRFNNKKL